MGNNYQDSDNMKKALYPIVPISLFFVGIIMACILPTVTIQWPETETPSPTATTVPTKTATPTPSATNTVTPIPATVTPLPSATRVSTVIRATATPQLAPFCSADTLTPSQCQFPIAKQSSTFCVKKSPYNLIALNERATYDVLHEHVQCSDAGIIDGQRMITCTAPMSFYFELRVCDSACSSLKIEKDSTRCPWGYSYNNLQGCCTKETQEVDQGCVVLKLRTESCAINCGQFTNASTCSDYGYACRWDNVNYICYLRK